MAAFIKLVCDVFDIVCLGYLIRTEPGPLNHNRYSLAWVGTGPRETISSQSRGLGKKRHRPELLGGAAASCRLGKPGEPVSLPLLSSPSSCL